MHQWGDDVITAPHQNTQATAMSVDVSGNLALLGSRRNLTLIDLNKPKEVVKRVSLSSKWDIGKVKWNPFDVNQQYFLSTYNQYADLWRYDSTTATKIVTFDGHTRAISDVDWSATDPNLLATCSLDQYIYLWDIRETKRAKLVTSTVSGASCVRWNKFDQNKLASSHDGNIRIWDIRNGKAPVQYITAHVSAINYLDWSPIYKDELASASQDTNISFWNTFENPREAKFQIHVQYPIWRAEYTPFGTAMASLAIMRNFRETPLALWNFEDLSQPVHIFNGHTDVVLDFQWRKNNDVIWQLVTWSKDQILRLWPIDYSLFLSCGGELSAEQYETSVRYLPDNNDQEIKKLIPQYNSSVSSVETQTSENILQGTLTPDVSDKHTFSSSPGGFPASIQSRGGSNSSLPDTLDQEFRLLNASLPNLTVNQKDKAGRFCTVTLRTTTHFLVIQMSFPSSYPQKESPIFKFLNWSENIDEDIQEKLLLKLRETANHHVRSNRGCLEPCLRQLAAKFREMSYNLEAAADQGTDLRVNQSIYSPLGPSLYRPDLHNIPFPRTSGARFCSAGYLVFFTRPTEVKGFHTNTGKMPRSLAGLLNHRRSVPVIPNMIFEKPFPSKQISCNDSEPAPFSVGAFFYKKRSRRSRYMPSATVKEHEHLASSIPNTVPTKHSRLHHSAGKVMVVDLTRIMPISRSLANEYIVPEQNNFSEACDHNKEKAAHEDMHDLVQLWSCASYLPNPNDTEVCNEYIRPFQAFPLGRSFLSNLLDHYSKLKDVQTLAMLACTFGTKTKTPNENHGNRRISQSFDIAVKRSISHQSFDLMHDSFYGLHKSSSESKFPEHQPSLTNWLTNIIARSPTAESAMARHVSESTMANYYKTPPESPPSDDYKFGDGQLINPTRSFQDKWYSECRMLDLDKKEKQYDVFKTSYCSLLERWKVNTKIAEIQKHVNVSSQPEFLVFKPTCQQCGQETSCTCPKDPFPNTIRCVICQLPVKSLWSFCDLCHHGGHVDHLQAWFSKFDYCPAPSGCPCDCKSARSPG